MKIGILALQGDFSKHGEHIQKLGLDPLYVRTPADLESADGLIIPGGESTTIGKLFVDFGLTETFIKRKTTLPVFGTCAGMIMMAKEIIGRDQFSLNLMDISIERNAYGRQIDSFEAEINTGIASLGTVQGVFIRAPRISRTGQEVEILASFEDFPVLIRQKNYLAASFHPELTENLNIHRYFIDMVNSTLESNNA